MVDEVLGDGLEVLSGGVDEAGSGERIDLSGDAAGELMDDGFGLRDEEVGRGSDLLESEVDIGGGLSRGERLDVEEDGDSVKEVAKVREMQIVREAVLAGEDDFDFGGGVERGGDQEAKVNEGIRGDEVSLVDEEKRGLLGGVGVVEDAKEEAFFAPGRSIFAEGREDDLEQRGGSEVGQMDVDGMEASEIEALKEQPEQAGLAHACDAHDGGDKAVLGEVVEPGQGLGHPLVGQKMLDRRMFTEGMSGHLEVLDEHGGSFPVCDSVCHCNRSCRA